MSRQKLEENLRAFYGEVDVRLTNLSPDQKQQFLEGLFLAFDAYSRFTAPPDITPLEQERFIASTKSDVYSRTYHLKLDPHTHMKPMMERSCGVAAKFVLAAQLHEAMELPINYDDMHALQNHLLAESLKTISVAPEELPSTPRQLT